jgi:hypothetical protein
MPSKKSRKKNTPPAPAAFDPGQFENEINFDSMEDKIRGEEILFSNENQKLREHQKITKELTDKEVDARLRDLIQRLGVISPKKKNR